MSTHGAIVRITGDSKFEGRYNHFDSYPTGLGKALWDVYHGYFKCNLDNMLKYLIDDHTGWSSICGADFSLPAGYDSSGPNCYCHGGRDEEGSLITEENALDGYYEYIYAFQKTKDGDIMLILSTSHKNSHKKDAKFAKLNQLASINLKHPEPNWQEIERSED